MRVIKNTKLRKILSQGPNYRNVWLLQSEKKKKYSLWFPALLKHTRIQTLNILSLLSKFIPQIKSIILFQWVYDNIFVNRKFRKNAKFLSNCKINFYFWENYFLFSYGEEHITSPILSDKIKSKRFNSTKYLIDNFCAMYVEGEFGRSFYDMYFTELELNFRFRVIILRF